MQIMMLNNETLCKLSEKIHDMKSATREPWKMCQNAIAAASTDDEWWMFHQLAFRCFHMYNLSFCSHIILVPNDVSDSRRRKRKTRVVCRLFHIFRLWRIRKNYSRRKMKIKLRKQPKSLKNMMLWQCEEIICVDVVEGSCTRVLEPREPQFLILVFLHRRRRQNNSEKKNLKIIKSATTTTRCQVYV